MSSAIPQQKLQPIDPQAQCPLFDLPAELRTRIWKYALASDIGIEYNAIWISKPPQNSSPYAFVFIGFDVVITTKLPIVHACFMRVLVKERRRNAASACKGCRQKANVSRDCHKRYTKAARTTSDLCISQPWSSSRVEEHASLIMSSNSPQQTSRNINAQNQSRLFSLPPELRNRIWEFALAGDIDLPYNAIWISSVRGCRRSPDTKIPPRCQISLLLTCRQTLTETEPLFYKTSAIVGKQQDLTFFLLSVSWARLFHVRAITFSADGVDITAFHRLRGLQRLKILHLIIPQDWVSRWADATKSKSEREALKCLRGLHDFRIYIQGTRPFRWSDKKFIIYTPEVLSDEDGIHVHTWWIGVNCMEEADGSSTGQLPLDALRALAKDIAAAVTQPRALLAASL